MKISFSLSIKANAPFPLMRIWKKPLSHWIYAMNTFVILRTFSSIVVLCLLLRIALMYGGSTERRARCVTNILQRVRKRIGLNKALGCHISGDELMPTGMEHSEACQIISLICDAGANYINRSQESYENVGAAFAPDGENEFTRWAAPLASKKRLAGYPSLRLIS